MPLMRSTRPESKYAEACQAKTHHGDTQRPPASLNALHGHDIEIGAWSLPFNRIYVNHQAYASGASPPGPGQISSNFFVSALLNLILRARKEPVNCSRVRGPMIGAVTTGFVSSHANATSAGFSPICLQNFSHASICVR